jgi:hypothetical protein
MDISARQIERRAQGGITMAETRYRAKIKHTEKTVQQLYKTQYYVFEKPRMLARMLIGFGLVIAAALMSLPVWVKALLLLFGAWFLVSRDFPASVRADKALSERKAALPGMEYVFDQDKVHLTGEGSMDIPYDKFTHLVEDNDYLYLFVSRNSVCMMERASLKPPQIMDFARFLEEKTGLTWRREKPFLSMSIYDIRQALRDMRGK